MGRERVAGRPKGPMSAYACFVQVIREEHKKKHPEEQINFAEFSKKCAEKWKTMTPKEKKRFEDMSVRDKERHEREMAQYNAVQQPPSSQRGDAGGGPVVVGRRRKRKMLKDKDAPKRALSAFFWFCEEHRAAVRTDHPEWRVGEMAKELSKRWEVCPNKPLYEGKAQADKSRYDQEMTLYRQSHNCAQHLLILNCDLCALSCSRLRHRHLHCHRLVCAVPGPAARRPRPNKVASPVPASAPASQPQPAHNSTLAAAATLAGMQQQGQTQQQQLLVGQGAMQAGAMRQVVSTQGGQTVILQTGGPGGQTVQLPAGMQLAPGQQLIATPAGLQVHQVQPGGGLVALNMIPVQGLQGVQALQGLPGTSGAQMTQLGIQSQPLNNAAHHLSAHEAQLVKQQNSGDGDPDGEDGEADGEEDGDGEGGESDGD
jgi:high mobility group protein B2